MSREPTRSRLALGCYPLGGGYGAVDAQDARRTIDTALDAGWTFLDTAEAYLDSEERVGRALKGRREKVFLATKAFPCEPYRYRNLLVALTNSLRRLRTDYLDLYQLHGPQDWVVEFPDAAPIEEVGAALARLVESGKVRHVGVCNMPLEVMEELRRHVPLYSTQNLYSLYDRGGNDPIHLPVGEVILPWARDHDVCFFAFSPLARGLLGAGLDPQRTFTPDDERHFLPRFQPDVYPHWAILSNTLEAWAADHGRTLPQLAVAWTLVNDAVTSTLIGAKSPAHVHALVGADEWHLTNSELDEIDALLTTLPTAAAAARSIVWDHFPPEAVAAMRDRRHDDPNQNQRSRTMSEIDQRPVLVCRIECPPHMAESVDDWMPKHFDDSLDHAAVTGVASYRMAHDFDATSGMPSLLNGHGNRFIVYAADTIEGLVEWIDSPIIREAIDDGVDRESAFPELDGEPFTGNIYEVSAVRNPLGADFPGPSVVFAERFEIGPGDEADFTSWLQGRHLDDLAALPGVIRARTFRQKRELPRRFPYTRYVSKGNYMALTEFVADADPVALSRGESFMAALADSARWDLRSPYVRREIAVNHVVRNKDDAASTVDARRAESGET